MAKKKTKKNPKGAGRNDKYGEPTKPVTKRVPESKVEQFHKQADAILKKWEKK